MTINKSSTDRQTDRQTHACTCSHTHAHLYLMKSDSVVG